MGGCILPTAHMFLGLSYLFLLYNKLKSENYLIVKIKNKKPCGDNYQNAAVLAAKPNASS